MTNSRAALERLLSSRDLVLAAGVVLIMASLEPFAISKAGLIPDRFFFYLLLPIMVWELWRNRQQLKANFFIAAVLVLQVFMFVWLYVRGGEVSTLLTGATIGVAGLIYLLIESRIISITGFATAFVGFMLLTLACAAVSVLLAYFGLLGPEVVFQRPGGGDVYRVGLTLSNEVLVGGYGYYVRPGGVFIESGQLGMYTTFAQIINAVILRNRRNEMALIVLGFFTSSLGYYLSLFAFLILFKRWRLLGAVVLLVVAVVVVKDGMSGVRDSLLWGWTVGRIIGIVDLDPGGNRAGATMTMLLNLNEIGLWGSGAILRSALGDVDATVLGPFLTYGWIGGLTIYLHVLMFFVAPFLLPRTENGKVRVGWIWRIFVLLGINLYHRPFVLHLSYYVILFALLVYEWSRLSAHNGKAGSSSLVPQGVMND